MRGGVVGVVIVVDDYNVRSGGVVMATLCGADGVLGGGGSKGEHGVVTGEWSLAALLVGGEGGDSDTGILEEVYGDASA